jgi:hypothetical protein
MSEDNSTESKSLAEELSRIRSEILGIRKDIQYSVAPRFLEISIETNDLVELAIEFWRMEHKISRISSTLAEDQRESLNSSMNKLKRYLDKNDIEIVDHTNQKYSDGENLEILAVEKDPNASDTIIKETKEPTILHKGEVIHLGKVIISSKEDTSVIEHD